MSKAGLQRTEDESKYSQGADNRVRKQKDDAEMANLFFIPESPLGTLLLFLDLLPSL